MKKIIRDFVLKGKEVSVGLEDAKRTWKICARSGGVVVHETTMEAKYENLRAYFQNKFPECKIRVIYEAGFSGFNTYDQLIGDGWDCIVTPPHTVTEEKSNRVKNDRVDCRRLAKNLENNDYKYCSVPDKELREDRQISRAYTQVQKDITRVKNRIRRTLEFHGIDRHFKPGVWADRLYLQMEEDLKKMEMTQSLKFSFEILIKELMFLRGLKKEIIKTLRKLAVSERYKKAVDIIKSSPGIGIFTAIRLALEWGEISRFTRKESFCKFLGITPSERSSGETEHKGHITKEGNSEIRRWLTEASWIAIKKDPALLEKFLAVAKNSGSRKKAIVAVARKLAVRLRALLLTGETYQLGVIQ